MLTSRTDVQMHLQPRHAHRRERHPGVRERNSNRRLRHQGPETPRMMSHTHTPRTADDRPQIAYSLDSAVSDFSRKRPLTKQLDVTHEETMTSRCQELSTVEAIRKSMKRTAKSNTCSTDRIPTWAIKLDINLDTSSVDIIPPFDEKENVEQNLGTNQSFHETVSFSYLDTDENFETSDDEEGQALVAKDSIQETSPAAGDIKEPKAHGDTDGSASTATQRIESNTFKTARNFSAHSFGKFS